MTQPTVAEPKARGTPPQDAKKNGRSREERDALILAHQGLVVKVAERFMRGSRVPLEDLVQAGNEGLAHAAYRFDPSKGAFSTYGWRWIHKFVIEEFQRLNWSIVIPSDMQRAIFRKNRVASVFETEHGRPPSPSELSASVAADGMSLHEAEELLGRIQAAEDQVLSLDRDLGEAREYSLLDLYADPDTRQADVLAEEVLLRETSEHVLSTLSSREESVIRLRFGLDDGRARTLEEIGREIWVTRERVRQIEAKALRKLRHPSRSRALRHLLGQSFSPAYLASARTPPDGASTSLRQQTRLSRRSHMSNLWVRRLYSHELRATYSSGKKSNGVDAT